MALTPEEIAAWLDRLSHVSDRMGETLAEHKRFCIEVTGLLQTQTQTLARLERTLEMILGHVQGRGNGTA